MPFPSALPGEINARFAWSIDAACEKAYPAITDPEKVGVLMLRIDGYNGMPAVKEPCSLWRLPSAAQTKSVMPNGASSILRTGFGVFSGEDENVA